MRNAKKLFNDLSIDEAKSIDRKEQCEDCDELKWLLCECEKQFTILTKYATNTLYSGLVSLYEEKLGRLSKKISSFEEGCEGFSFDDFIRIKYELRAILKQIVGIHTSFNWQSPSSSNKPEDVIECSLLQKGQFIYMRTHTSDILEGIEKKLLEEYYGIPANDVRTVGHLTNSGMKALEVAIVLQRMTCKDDLPIYYHDGTYFESKELINRLYKDPIQLGADEIYRKLDSNERIGCLIIDAGVNWPNKKSIDMPIFFEKLQRHSQTDPIFVIVDCTLTSIASNIIGKYRDVLPKHAILVIVESMLKYFQMGMELTNLGFVLFQGYLLERQLFKDIVFDILRTVTAIPDDSLVKRLPMFSSDIFKKRMKRLSRNTKCFFRYFEELKQKGIVEGVTTSVSPSSEFAIDEEKWVGSIIYLRLKGFKDIEQYEDFSKRFVEQSSNTLVCYGMSFGFDTTRFCAVQDLKAEISEGLCLRISVGRERLVEIERMILDFDEYIVKKLMH